MPRRSDLPPPGHGKQGKPSRDLLPFLLMLIAAALALSLAAGLVGLAALLIEKP